MHAPRAVPRALHLLLLCLAGLGLALSAQAAAPPASVTYTRSFPRSVPVFLQIVVRRDGSALYAARQTARQPVLHFPFTASPPTVRAIFRAAAALDDFRGVRLQSKDNVAFTGDKTLAYADGSLRALQHFTYTTLPPARTLVNLFERISTTGMDALRLRLAARYQPLNVLEALDQIQSDWSLHLLAEPQLLAPVLRRLLADPTQMQAAQRRAQKLLVQMHQRY